MTFEDAFNAAADRAKEVTFAGERPMACYRFRAMEACRTCCAESWRNSRTLPTRWQLRSAVMREVGFGPFVWLWVAVMVAKLLVNLRELLFRGGATEP